MEFHWIRKKNKSTLYYEYCRQLVWITFMVGCHPPEVERVSC
jgi:hypothetical protein